ncbi:proteasome assembly chaperone 1 isoform X2 [Amia ocellicauda]|uniref:proteasome assembly chaperone 1 isoform X2 n=1 Tax=Amia ocellicauda TaxID=2972642 RepID=UPI003463926F
MTEMKREVHLNWRSEIAESIESSSDKTFQCSDLVIAVGQNASGFLSAFVLSTGNWDVVGTVTLWNERTKGPSQVTNTQLPEESRCVLYRQAACPSVVICQCTYYVAEDQLFQWTEKVLGSIQRRGLRVLVLSDCSVAEYKTSECITASPSPFLRTLKTSEYRDALRCPLMEQPNILTGLPAAVLSHCQVHRIPAVVYQCYSDVACPDSLTMEAYRPALSCLSSKLGKVDYNPSTEVLRKVVRVSEAQSNLYT